MLPHFPLDVAPERFNAVNVVVVPCEFLAVIDPSVPVTPVYQAVIAAPFIRVDVRLRY